jgi:flagellar biosynthesis/type III secretory pathway M-ring protein FliF/YscJ
MKKKKTIILAAIVVAVIALTVIMLLVNRKKETDTGIFPLQQGSRGLEVTKLQQYLNEQSKDLQLQNIAVDGIFGKETEGRLLMITGKKSVSHLWYKNNI